MFPLRPLTGGSTGGASPTGRRRPTGVAYVAFSDALRLGHFRPASLGVAYHTQKIKNASRYDYDQADIKKRPQVQAQ